MLRSLIILRFEDLEKEKKRKKRERERKREAFYNLRNSGRIADTADYSLLEHLGNGE
jgi:hypothetical protein